MVTILLETVVYLSLGLVMMLLGHWIIDLCIPLDVPKEIHDGNKAVGFVSAGIYAGLGFVLRSAIISNSIAEELDMLEGAIDIVNKKFNFNEALKEKNEATGIMIFGIFMGIAFLVSGVIQ